MVEAGQAGPWHQQGMARWSMPDQWARRGCACALYPVRGLHWCSYFHFQVWFIGTMQRMDQREAGTVVGEHLWRFHRSTGLCGDLAVERFLWWLREIYGLKIKLVEFSDGLDNGEKGGKKLKDDSRETWWNYLSRAAVRKRWEDVHTHPGCQSAGTLIFLPCYLSLSQPICAVTYLWA